METLKTKKVSKVLQKFNIRFKMFNLIALFLQKINRVQIKKYQSIFLEHLQSSSYLNEPKGLYEPIEYILNLGGKRLRPSLVLMSCEAFGSEVSQALDAALAVEVFHNFSLVHDDIMDEAPIRRGQETVHKKWDLNTGILSGDAMMILAYQLFETYPAEIFKALAELFSKTALEVCEGQQYDIEFESREQVAIKDYLKMIEYKTAVLVAASLKMGAIVAQASAKDAQNIYDFGLHLGIAFQLQDDYLDVFGDDDFGKQKAGDIVENKKTWLYIKALELANDEDRKLLLDLYTGQVADNELKIQKVTALYKKYRVDQLIEREIERYTSMALNYCKQCTFSAHYKAEFENLSNFLMHRTI